MRILCTGSHGFIGSHLVEKLINEGHNVACVDDLSGGSLKNLPEEIALIQIDLRNSRAIDAFIQGFKPEIVYHLAANAAEQKAQFSPIDITSRNWNAFINVLTPFIKYGGKRFVFTSSIAVYGALQTPFKETDEPHPEDLYGISKLACEQALKVMAKVHGFEYVIARPHNVYGPRQNMRDPYRNVVTIWMNSILKGEPWYIYGDGEQRRCFSYIDDVVAALYKTGFEDVSGMTFNIGADKDYSLNELATWFVGYFQTLREYLPARAQEVAEAIADHTLAKKHLGYSDSVSLTQGLAKTAEWAKEQGPQKLIYTELELPDSPLIPQNWLTK